MDTLSALANDLATLDASPFVLSDGETELVVHSDDPTMREWLTTYLYCYTVTQASAASSSVTIVHSRRPQLRACWRRRHAALASRHTSADYYHNQRAAVAKWSGCRIVVPAAGADPEVLVRDGNAIAILTDRKEVVSRVIRDVFTRLAENRGQRLLQCTVLELLGSALILCSKQGSGKSTLLMELLHRSRGSLMTHDRLVVGREGGVPRFAAWPTGFLLSWRSVREYTEVATAYRSGHRPQYPQEEFWRQRPDAFSDSLSDARKVEVLPVELELFFGASLRSQLNPQRILFFDRTSADRSQAVAPADAAGLLRSLFFPYRDGMYPDVLALREFDASGYDDRVEVLAALLASMLPAHQIEALDDQRIADHVYRLLNEPVSRRQCA